MNGETLDVPCAAGSRRWGKIQAALRREIADVESLKVAMSTFQEAGEVDLRGLSAALEGRGGGEDITSAFFDITLPSIVASALRLPELLPAKGGITMLHQLPCSEEEAHEACCVLDRALVRSLLSHMFLCTFDDFPPHSKGEMPMRNFTELLAVKHPAYEKSELAKLRMMIHYFERTCDGIHGNLRITRRGMAHPDDAWMASERPLLPMEVVPRMVGFEDPLHGQKCLHADFANMFLGGGVICGGNVQEEIRFSICPELMAAMLLCPVMLPHEAIQIIGAEQFSAYGGYGGRLEYAGSFEDPSPREADGTVLNGIAAIDALDGRHGSFDLRFQLRIENMLREMNKAAAGFQLPAGDAATAAAFPCVATGNWGCGVFGGFVELKALLQWLAASEKGIALRYFPFDEDFGPRLEQSTKELVDRKVTVGQLWRALAGLSESPARDWLMKAAKGKGGFLEGVSQEVAVALAPLPKRN